MAPVPLAGADHRVPNWRRDPERLGFREATVEDAELADAWLCDHVLSQDQNWHRL